MGKGTIKIILIEMQRLNWGIKKGNRNETIP
jgi:hypothetical protein